MIHYTSNVSPTGRRAGPGRRFGWGAAQQLDLYRGPAAPGQRLQADKPGNRWRKEAVEHLQMAISVGLKHLGGA